MPLTIIAFAISLFVQSMSSPLAGAWLLFLLAGCAAILYRGGYPKSRGIVWYACLAWLVTLGASTFLFAPVHNGAATMWILAAMPILALCLRKEHLKPFSIGFLVIITCYSLGLITQMALHTQTTLFNYPGRYAWPLLDPNNAAAVINLALLPCIWLTLFKNVRWIAFSALFAIAMVATGSKAGIGAALLGCFILLSARFGEEMLFALTSFGTAIAVNTFYYRPDLFLMLTDSFKDRFPIWEASWPLVWVRPLGGLGLGTFSYYYQQVRTETYTAGSFAHNDLLQFAIEAGVPGAFVFFALMLAVAFTTCRNNLVSAVVILAIFLESMVEFQFYLPAISIPLGLALAYHMINNKGPNPCR